MSDNLPNNRSVEQDSESCSKVRKSRNKLMLILLAATIGLPVVGGAYAIFNSYRRGITDAEINEMLKDKTKYPDSKRIERAPLQKAEENDEEKKQKPAKKGKKFDKSKEKGRDEEKVPIFADGVKLA